MKHIVLLMLVLSFYGCSTKNVDVSQTTKTREQVLYPEKFYVPHGMDVDFKLISGEMKIIDILSQIEYQSGYSYQIYDIREIGEYKVKFSDLKLNSIEALKEIDKQYSDVLIIDIHEDGKTITVKKMK